MTHLLPRACIVWRGLPSPFPCLSLCVRLTSPGHNGEPQVLSREAFENNIRRVAAWKKEADMSTATGVKGILHIDSRSLRDKLVEVTAGALDDMKGALARRAAAFTAELLDEARAMIKWLDERPADLDGFAAYKRRYASSADAVATFDKRVEDVLGVQVGYPVTSASLGLEISLPMPEYALVVGATHCRTARKVLCARSSWACTASSSCMITS